MNRQSNAKGFTIIEVVLVLAIAGLIFLVVFLALPALQRSQRDTQRKQDLGKFSSQLTAYQSNNQGLLPGQTAGNPASTTAAWNTFVGNYLTNGGQTFSDPQSSTYSVTYQTTQTNTSGLTSGNIWTYIGYKCDSSQASGVSANTGVRNYALLIFQEQGGYYCQSN